MIEWIIAFLVAKWWSDRKEKKGFSGNIDYNVIPYGYVRDGESIRDLQ
jgi:hypothetical protein